MPRIVRRRKDRKQAERDVNWRIDSLRRLLRELQLEWRRAQRGKRRDE